MATMSYLAFLILVGHSPLPYLLTVSFANDNDLIITTKDGKVQGKVSSVLGGKVRVFLGIPDAKPPLGKLRSRAPEAVDKWEGVKPPTTETPAISYQRQPFQLCRVGRKPFIYFFQHRSSINPRPEGTGVLHGYETEFVFGMPLNAPTQYTKEEVEMSERLMRHWADLARTG